MSELGEQTVELVPNLRRTDEDIKGAVDKWLRDPAAAEASHGHITLVKDVRIVHMFPWLGLFFPTGKTGRFLKNLAGRLANKEAEAQPMEG